MFTRALDIRCSILGDSHLDTAASFCSLGERFKPSSLGLLLSILVAPLASRGNLPQASNTREMLKCSTVDDRSLWLRAGHMALGCGRLYDALDHYGKAADVRFAQLGKNHLDTASSYVNIGNVCVRQGKYAEALGLYRKVRPVRICGFDTHVHALRFLRLLVNARSQTVCQGSRYCCETARRGFSVL